jgi:hypothetical protein
MNPRKTPAILVPALMLAWTTTNAALWVGNTSNDLSIGSNWDTGAAPNPAEAQFGPAGNSGTALTTSSSLQFAPTRFLSTAPAYVISGGGQITFGTSAVINEGALIQTINNPTRLNTGSSFTLAANSGSIVLNGLHNINAATSATRTFNIAFGATNGASFVFNGAIQNSNSNPGTGNLTVANVSNVNANGRVELNNSDNAGLNGTVSVGRNITLSIGANNALSSATSVALGSSGNTGAVLNLNSNSTTVNGSLTFNPSTQVAFNLATPGNSTALLGLTGALTQAGTGTYTITLGGNTDTTGTFKLISFASTNFANASAFTLNTDGSGNLQLINNELLYVVPEPSAYALIIAAIALIGVVVRRRKLG